ncbi:MAG: hypothetical protein M3680_16655 [Myxococcota bacterium]|nr:hypothetical protein [Myxococcota bacterium]
MSLRSATRDGGGDGERYGIGRSSAAFGGRDGFAFDADVDPDFAAVCLRFDATPRDRFVARVDFAVGADFAALADLVEVAAFVDFAEVAGLLDDVDVGDFRAAFPNFGGEAATGAGWRSFTIAASSACAAAGPIATPQATVAESTSRTSRCMRAMVRDRAAADNGNTRMPLPMATQFPVAARCPATGTEAAGDLWRSVRRKPARSELYRTITIISSVRADREPAHEFRGEVTC